MKLLRNLDLLLNTQGDVQKGKKKKRQQLFVSVTLSFSKEKCKRSGAYGVARLGLAHAPTSSKDKISLQELRPWPNQREWSLWSQALLSPGHQCSPNEFSPAPRAPDCGRKPDCTCRISPQITLLLWKIVCYFGTPWQPEWIAEGPKLVYLCQKHSQMNATSPSTWRMGRRLVRVKITEGCGNDAEWS